MVADHHGLRMDMADLRRRFTLSLKVFGQWNL
jgi:hypothetical protein